MGCKLFEGSEPAGLVEPALKLVTSDTLIKQPNGKEKKYMLFSHMGTNVDKTPQKTEYSGNLDIIATDEVELIIAHNLLLSSEEIMIIPKSYYNLMKKFQYDFFNMISEKYPEAAMSNDYMQAVAYAKSIKM